MIRHAVALRYAKALFQVDQKTHGYKNRIKDFECLFKLCKEQPKFLQILEAPLISQKDKESLINKALKDHVDDVFLNFLLLFGFI